MNLTRLAAAFLVFMAGLMQVPGWCASNPSSIELPYYRDFFSPSPDHLSDFYVVRRGDNLYSIAQKFNATPDLLLQMNGQTRPSIQIGQRLKVPAEKLSLFVDKSDNYMLLKVGNRALKRYLVSTGRDNSTPTGDFEITVKLEHPTWYKDDGQVIPSGTEENHLGTRWMGINLKGYGIHGTVEPQHLGKQVSHGCIRMKNEDVEELFRWIPSGTRVTVVN